MTTMTEQTDEAAAGMVKCAAIWGRDGQALAAYYAAALGWEVTQTFGEAATMISDGTTKYVFYTAESFQAPNWPEDELVFHLDLASAMSRRPRIASSGLAPPNPPTNPAASTGPCCSTPPASPSASAPPARTGETRTWPARQTKWHSAWEAAASCEGACLVSRA
ncbi:hypothetical protein [Streptomyces sp. NBC_00443]|uniref:hypothetical protein n=1 Tax=Streptomyces sp. NBC_00443 TaxID=2975743 RepID=UPI002E21B341